MNACGAYSEYTAIVTGTTADLPAPTNFKADRISSTPALDVRCYWDPYPGGTGYSGIRVARLDPGENPSNVGQWDHVLTVLAVGKNKVGQLEPAVRIGPHPLVRRVIENVVGHVARTLTLLGQRRSPRPPPLLGSLHADGHRLLQHAMLLAPAGEFERFEPLRRVSAVDVLVRPQSGRPRRLIAQLTGREVPTPCPIWIVVHIARMAIQLAPRVEVVHAMTWNGRNGNPAGVVLDASALSDEQRQAIATRVGHSETAFLERKLDGRYALAFFTPKRPIAFCGHATIATFAYLRCKGLETRDAVDVRISGTDLRVHYDGDVVLMEQKAPRYERLPDSEIAEALRSIGLDSDALDSRFRPQVVDTGGRFLLVSVRDSATLAAAQPDATAIEALSERLDLVGYYVFLRTPGEHAATARMFAPRYGIAEECATGMAAGPLAAALVDVFGHEGATLRILQGEFMTPPRPSEILAQLDVRDSKVVGLRVGGRAALQPGAIQA